MAKRGWVGVVGIEFEAQDAFWVWTAVRCARLQPAARGAAETVEGATIWLTRARSRQATQTVVLIMMSRTERLLIARF